MKGRPPVWAPTERSGWFVGVLVVSGPPRVRRAFSPGVNAGGAEGLRDSKSLLRPWAECGGTYAGAGISFPTLSINA